MDEVTRHNVSAALARIPQGVFVLTARHEDRRAGVLVSWVQQASFDPPMVSIAVAKGRGIMALISESGRFGLCQVPDGDHTLLRRFASSAPDGADPFLGLELPHQPHILVPVLAASMAFLECQVIRHLDIEADHDVFVGQALHGEYFGGQPCIRLRSDGLNY